MNYVLSFCKVTAASKIFSRNFYLPLLKPLTPKDALRTFRITGKWLLGSKIQHYIPVLLNHRQKRSKRDKNYGKVEHRPMEDYVYMMPVLDPDNIENQKILISGVLNGRKGKGRFVYTVNDKNYNLVVDAALELAIRDGEVIDVLMSQGTDRILVKLKNFKKIPVDIQNYTGNGKLYNGEGATTKEDERHHHHGKQTMSIVKIFEDLERKEEKWEEELKRLLAKRKKQPGEDTKEWNDMVRAATANMDWKKYEKQAKRIVQYIEEPVVEYYVGMEVEDFNKTKNAQELLEHNAEMLNHLPTLSEIPELINNLSDAVVEEIDIDGSKLSGAFVILPSGKKCFVVGQMVKTEEGEIFLPGQTEENEFGVEYRPGITIIMDGKPALVKGLIVGEADNKNPMFAPLECFITEAGYLSFTATKEERVKYKPRKVPVKKVIKSISQNPEDNYEEYYYEDTEEFASEDAQKIKKTRRVVKKRRVAPPGCVYNVAEEDQYEEEEYSEYEEIDEDEEQALEQEFATANGDAEDTSSQSTEEPLTLEDIIERHKNAVDPRVAAAKEIIEEERMMFKAMDAKIEELIENIEVKTTEVKEKLEELRNLTVVQEIDPISTASIEDAAEIALKITDHLPDANVVSEILLTMVRRVAGIPDRNAVKIANINNFNQNGRLDARSRHREKLKIALKTAMVAANNVFQNRPKDEVSALKAIGTVLTLALQDQDELIGELCSQMDDARDRNEICVMLLKELSQKHKKNKLKTLTAIVESDNDFDDDGKIVDKLREVLEKQGDVIGPAFKKISKDNPELLQEVIEFVRSDVKSMETECNATRTLQDAIVKSVRKIAEQDLRNFVNGADEEQLRDLIAEAVAFSRVLSLNGTTEDLQNLPLNAKILSAGDNACLSLLRRLFVIRKLAANDRGQAAALREVKKRPEFGIKNPRIRQLVRESAGLISNAMPIKNSKQIPERLFEECNSVALEDFLIQKSRIDLPVLVSKRGREAVVPQELTKDVLDGRIPYVLLDEDGVSKMKPLKKFQTNGVPESPVEEYDAFEAKKKDEKWAEVPAPNYGKIDTVTQTQNHKAMLFKPVYLKPKMREQAPIRMTTPTYTPPAPPEEPEPEPPPPPPPPPAPPAPQTEEAEEEERHLPVLVCKNNTHVVYPPEARRDVLAGRVAYVYLDEKGMSIFKPKHIFSALKLDRKRRTQYENYPCIGARERILERRNKRIYEGREQRAMSSFSRGSIGPSA